MEDVGHQQKIHGYAKVFRELLNTIGNYYLTVMYRLQTACSLWGKGEKVKRSRRKL